MYLITYSTWIKPNFAKNSNKLKRLLNIVKYSRDDIAIFFELDKYAKVIFYFVTMIRELEQEEFIFTSQQRNWNTA